jgi:hypothetical protein
MRARARAVAVERTARPTWDWDGLRPLSALGWVAVSAAAAHAALLVVVQWRHATYWQPEALWSDPHVVAAAIAFGATAIGGAIAALVATIRFGEHSVLMLVPTVLGAFWALWLLAQVSGWLS